MILRKKQRADYIIALIVFALVVFGIIMISSASVVKSYQITDGKSNYYFLIRQLIALGIGLFVWFIFYHINYNFWKKYAIHILLFSILLLILVFVPHIGKTMGGASRWIGSSFFSFQPSELAKLGMIIFLAAWFDKRKDKITSLWGTFVPFILITGVILGLIIKQPDIGTALIFAIIAIAMYFLAGANLFHLGLFIPLFAIIFWFLVKITPYRLARIITFLNPKTDVLGISYHIHQTLIAIGSGGIFGLGFGNSKQKYNYLPEAHTDSIYAIICEELGFIRAIIVIIAFVFFAFRGLFIVKKTANNFGKLLAFGIVIWFVSQAFVNLGVMLGFLPFTGVPLPFISYGGSSLVISLAAVGILLNISKQGA